jgi:dihydropteroate synthase
LTRKLYTWKLKDREIRLGERTLIVGVLNVTPDSFSDGSLYDDPDRAYARALELEEQGADIIDIGAESTKPGSIRISAAEEIRRLIPVLKRLKGELRIPISVDTYKAEVAELAIEHGAEIINDPSGFTWDPLLAKVIVQNDAGLILNHMRGTPETWGKLGPIPDVMLAITKDLDASISRARRAGVDRVSIVLDPGLGFGKRKEQNAEILARLADLAKLDYPILVGPSRKSFLATESDLETKFATAAAVTAAVLSGSHMVRVHDVAEMKAALGVADEVLRAVPVPGETVEPSAAPRRSSSPEAKATAPSKPPRPKLRLLREVEPEPAPMREPEPHIPTEVPPIPPAGDDDEDFEEEVFLIDPNTDEEPIEKKPVERKPAAKPFADKPRYEKTERKPYERSTGPRKFAPRSGPPRDFRPQRSTGPGDDRPKRFGGPRDDRPQRSGPPRSGPPRSGPPRSGPPRDDRPPRSGPPRSGPPRDDRPERSGPPREWRPSGPPRPGGSRDDRPPRSGPPRSGPPRSGPPRSGPPRSGPPRSGPPRGGPRSGPPRGGPRQGR